MSSALNTGTGFLGTSGVTAGTYGSGTTVFPILTINAQGQVTAASTGTVSAGTGGGITSYGGYANKLRNPVFDIWQRGTSIAVANGGTGSYTADGWIVATTGAGVTVSANNGYGVLGTYVMSIASATGNTKVQLKQRLEASITTQLTGQYTSFGLGTLTPITVTLFWGNNSGSTITPNLIINNSTATDNFTGTSTIVASTALQAVTNGNYGTTTYTIPNSSITSVTHNLELIFDFGALSTAGKSIQIFGVDLRPTPGVTGTGVNATGATPAIEIRPIAEELAFCQRYLPAIGSGDGGPGFTSSTGANTICNMQIPLKVTTRSPLTGLLQIGAANSAIQIGTAGISLGSSTLSFVGGYSGSNSVAVTGSSTTSVSYSTATALLWYAQNTILFTGAEL